MTFADRISRNTATSETGCLVWTGSVSKDGYVRVKIGSRTDGTRRSALAHRVAYETLVGPIPDGLELDHLCNVRHCVNTAHLEPVTPDENSRRRSERQTHCKWGHEFTPANTYRNPRDGARCCRACNRTLRSRKRFRTLEETTP